MLCPRAAGVKLGGFACLQTLVFKSLSAVAGSIPAAAWLAPGKKAVSSSVAMGDLFLYAPLDNRAPQTFAVRGAGPLAAKVDGAGIGPAN
jgi:hypothetical protein